MPAISGSVTIQASVVTAITCPPYSPSAPQRVAKNPEAYAVANAIEIR